NLVQNFVKIFYSFGEGISPAALHKLEINLSKILGARALIRNKLGRDACGGASFYRTHCFRLGRSITKKHG
ncbi:MAG: hypothetical protein MJZ54_07665, partial [Bacteroidaceae bacterium]|nr:hypothetical protein [Bacteroidaceae bacterium]